MSIAVITLGALYYTSVQSASMPSSSSATEDEDEEEEEEEKRDAGTTTRMRKGSRIPKEWYRNHGHTYSLATLLPLHAPRPLRPFGGSSHGANGNATGGGRFLGSISEEEGYYASLARAGSEEDGDVVDEEKMALLPEEDRARFFHDHVERVRGRDQRESTQI